MLARAEGAFAGAPEHCTTERRPGGDSLYDSHPESVDLIVTSPKKSESKTDTLAQPHLALSLREYCVIRKRLDRLIEAFDELNEPISVRDFVKWEPFSISNGHHDKIGL